MKTVFIQMHSSSSQFGHTDWQPLRGVLNAWPWKLIARKYSPERAEEL